MNRKFIIILASAFAAVMITCTVIVVFVFSGMSQNESVTDMGSGGSSEMASNSIAEGAAMDMGMEATKMADGANQAATMSTATTTNPKTVGTSLIADEVVVTGQGQLQVAPDVAYISITIETNAETAKEVEKANAKKVEAVQKVLASKFGVGEKDIRSTGFYIQPNYSYNQLLGTSKIVGYVATHSFEVTTRNLLGIGDLLDEAINAGTNRVDGIRLDTEKKEQYEVQALKLAVDNAKMKATALAEAAGRKLGKVNRIAESYVSSEPIYTGVNIALSKQVADMSGMTTISTGEITVNASVTVAYQLTQ